MRSTSALMSSFSGMKISLLWIQQCSTLAGGVAPMSKAKIVWKKKPEQKDFAGALAYLTLLYPKSRAEKLMRALQKADVIEHVAKDLLRASGLPLLDREEPQVDEDLARIHKG